MDHSNSDTYILIIKDEPYEVIFEEETGLINQTIDADLEKRERRYTINGKEIPEINILWNVKGITPEVASGLDTREQIQLLKDYLLGRKILNSIKNHEDSHIAAAKNDYDRAVSCIFTEAHDYEYSCAASVQFACRLLRAKLRAAGKTFEGDLSLTELAQKLDDEESREIENILPWVQRSPEGSEADSAATLDDAVNALRSSVALFIKLFPDKKDEKEKRGFINISS